MALAKEEIERYNFVIAKVSQNSRSGDYVCCLYWKDDSRKRELFERHRHDTVLKYRWWKSNADTRARKYSPQFKATLLDPDPQQDDAADNMFGIIHDGD